MMNYNCYFGLCFFLFSSHALSLEYVDINIHPTSSIMYIHNEYYLYVTSRGRLASNIEHRSILFCVYNAMNPVQQWRFEYQQSDQLGSYCVPIQDMMFNINITLPIIFSNPGSYMYVAAIVSTNHQGHKDNVSNSYKIHAESFTLMDILPPHQDIPANSTISYSHEGYVQDNIAVKYNKENDIIPFRISIFLKDLDVHGANARLVRFYCTYLNNAVKDVVVDILSAESSGDFLDTIKNCGATIISTSHEATSSAFSSTKKSKIIIEPALSLAVLKDSKEIELNPSLLLYLSTVNAVIALNTLGDVQTDALLTYVSVIRSNTLNPTQRRFPKVYLDLCNLPEFDDMFKGKWMSIVDGFIAPSQYVQYHYQTLQHHKPVALVYPSLDYNNSATSDPYNDVVRNIWPRKVNGRFRIGCIGRLSYDRNPGLCIHALATLLNRHNDLYNTFNLEFVVIGGGSLLNDMIALAKDLNILEYITFLGARKNVERDLALLDLAVNTKVQGETFGILNVECMMTKTPVIAFNRSANQESLHPLSRILIENISVDELVNAIIGVVVSPEKYGLSVSGLTQAEREMRLIVNPVIQAQKMIGVLYNMWLNDQSM